MTCIFMLCLIVVPLLPGKNPFAVQLNNNNNSNQIIVMSPSRWPRGTFYPHKLTITSPTIGGRSVGIVRSRTQTMEFLVFFSHESHGTH
jgi:hypothetical protein